MSATEVKEVQTESSKVEAWRLHVLIEAHYPRKLAERLARHSDIDLHLAVEMVGNGCQPETAAKILL